MPAPLFTDTTERGRLEQSLKRANETLRRLNQCQGQFAFAAAHDMREPVPLHAHSGWKRSLMTFCDSLVSLNRKGFVPTDTQWINTRCSARSDRTCQSCFSTQWRGFTSRQLCRSSIGLRSISGKLKISRQTQSSTAPQTGHPKAMASDWRSAARSWKTTEVVSGSSQSQAARIEVLLHDSTCKSP